MSEDEAEGPSLAKRVSASEQADALWKRQYEALRRGEVLAECLQPQNLQCLDYYPLTLVLGRAFEQVGRVLQTKGETGLARLFLLIGRAFSYLGVRWQQSGKCRPLRLPAGQSDSAAAEGGQSGYLSLGEK